MCEPISLSIAAASLAGGAGAAAGISTGAIIMGAITTGISTYAALEATKQQNAMTAAANKRQTSIAMQQNKISNDALAFKYDATQDRLDEESKAYTARKQEANADYWRTVGRLQVSADAAGISDISTNVEAIRSEMGIGLGRTNVALSHNLAASIRQHNREDWGYQSQAKGQILAATPKYTAQASYVGPMLAAVSEGSANLDFFSQGEEGGSFGQKAGKLFSGKK